MVRMILLIPMLLATLVVSASAQSPPEPELAGLYTSDGVNPDGSRYHGQVEILRVVETMEMNSWAMLRSALSLP